MTHPPTWFEQPRGLLRLRGQDSVPFVHRMCTQDVRPLSTPNRTALALFLNGKGRLIDEVQLVQEEDGLLISTAPHRAQALMDWLLPFTIMEEIDYGVVAQAAATFTLTFDESHAPQVTAVLRSLGFEGPPAADDAVTRTQGGSAFVTRARAAYGQGVVITAPDGAQGVLVADALQAAFGPRLTAAQLERRLILAGVASPEHEYLSPAAPFELRLGAESIHWHKGCYIGQEIISRLEAYDKVARLMMGVRAERGADALFTAPKEARILHAGIAIGKLMRAVPDETGLGLLGLCTVKREWAKPMAIELVGASGEAVPGALFDCPQWQR